MKSTDNTRASMAELDPENSGNSQARNDSSTGLVMPSSFPGGRRRSLSVATAQPSLETVVVKAKRAASSLWILLHAKNCVVAARCPHIGCYAAKLLHLHLKTCPAGEGFPCPIRYNGCEQSRKLLAHYRRCRTTRARQAGQLGGLRRDTGHNCLICTLVARQARTMLYKGDGGAMPPSNSSVLSRAPTIYHSLKSSTQTFTSPFMLVANNNAAEPEADSFNDGMAPPPPRDPTSSTSSDSTHTIHSGFSSAGPVIWSDNHGDESSDLGSHFESSDDFFLFPKPSLSRGRSLSESLNVSISDGTVCDSLWAIQRVRSASVGSSISNPGSGHNESIEDESSAERNSRASVNDGLHNDLTS